MNVDRLMLELCEREVGSRKNRDSKSFSELKARWAAEKEAEGKTPAAPKKKPVPGKRRAQAAEKARGFGAKALAKAKELGKAGVAKAKEVADTGVIGDVKRGIGAARATRKANDLKLATAASQGLEKLKPAIQGLSQTKNRKLRKFGKKLTQFADLLAQNVASAQQAAGGGEATPEEAAAPAEETPAKEPTGLSADNVRSESLIESVIINRTLQQIEETFQEIELIEGLSADDREAVEELLRAYRGKPHDRLLLDLNEREG